MHKSIIRSYLIAVISLSAVTSQANAYCSCWSSTNSRAYGATCGAGLDFDTGWLSYDTCLVWCQQNADSGHQWAYVDKPAFKACNESFKSVTRAPSRRDCWMVMFTNGFMPINPLIKALKDHGVSCPNFAHGKPKSAHPSLKKIK